MSGGVVSGNSNTRDDLRLSPEFSEILHMLNSLEMRFTTNSLDSA
jgi:hypothetical protein